MDNVMIECLYPAYWAMVPVFLIVIMAVCSEEKLTLNQRLLVCSTAFMWPILLFLAIASFVYDFFHWILTGRTYFHT